MKVFVNGEPRETGALHISALLAELGQQPKTTLVEHDGIALRPDEWNTSALREGDRIELLRIVAGG